MMKTNSKRTRKELVSQETTPIVETINPDEITMDDAIATLDTEELAEVEDEDENIERRGRPTNEERCDTDRQKVEMKLIGGVILRHFREAVEKKQLDFNQELQLFKTISPYLGYVKDGNKLPADIGMDSFAMRYIEVNAKVNTALRRQSSKS